jgi:hypothetical protein
MLDSIGETSTPTNPRTLQLRVCVPQRFTDLLPPANVDLSYTLTVFDRQHG